jgi:hypothetical protein
MLVWIVTRNAPEQLALGRFFRIDHRFGTMDIARVVPHIKPQVGFAPVCTWPVAMEAIVGQDWPYIAREIKW